MSDDVRAPAARPAPLWQRVHRRLGRAVRHDRTLIALVAGPRATLPPPPPGFELLWCSATHAPQPALIRRAMRAHGEPDDVAVRFAHGDVFFAWLDHGLVATFGWATDRDRLLGVRHACHRDGRWYLYNFRTRPEYRGRGLYPALLEAIEAVLGERGARELILDIVATNAASLRGAAKAGFVPVGRTTTRLVASRWHREVPGATVEVSGAGLFDPPGRIVDAL